MHQGFALCYLVLCPSQFSLRCPHWGAVPFFFSVKYLCAMSLTVLVAAQKKGGLSDQPIGSAFGIISSILSSSTTSTLGRTYAKFHSSSLFTTILHYPSFRSIFVKRIRTPLSGADAIDHMIRGITFPRLYIACCGAEFCWMICLPILSFLC